MVAERVVSEKVIVELRGKLTDVSTSLPQKYRVLFSLRNIKGEAAREALAAALADNSALLRHEVAYCLGQRQDPASVPLLTRILADRSEHPMVRHEAGEALGAICTDECLPPLQQHQRDASLEVAETCDLALARIAAFRSAAGAPGDASADESVYLSVDPTPAAPASTPLAELRASLLDEAAPMPERYAALFGLRNKGGAEAVAALAESFGARSALLKHEVAYVLGQMQHVDAFPVLKRVLEDETENPMVRHEAAEALGAIADPQCLQLLHARCSDPEPIVAHSCEVALDMLEFEASGQMEYADVGRVA